MDEIGFRISREVDSRAMREGIGAVGRVGRVAAGGGGQGRGRRRMLRDGGRATAQGGLEYSNKTLRQLGCFAYLTSRSMRSNSCRKKPTGAVRVGEDLWEGRERRVERASFVDEEAGGGEQPPPHASGLQQAKCARLSHGCERQWRRPYLGAALPALRSTARSLTFCAALR